MNAQRFRRVVTGAALIVGGWAGSLPEAHADIPLSGWAEAWAQLPDGGERMREMMAPGSHAPTVLLHTAPLNGPAVRVGANRWVAPLEDLVGRSDRNADLAFFGPARFLAMNRVVLATGQREAFEATGLSGSGTVIGIVDTGVDLSHPAFRRADGTTRVRWLLDFGTAARGVHPELERAYGCSDVDRCAVYGEADINELLEGDRIDELPRDRIGHGSHIASLAAGRGDAYPGMAPGADLIIVGAANEFGGVTDARILQGTQFVFDRADALGEPAVVNVSLGSNFGAHDGNSEVEQGLSELARGPGRAIVVAAGNSGQLYGGLESSLPQPFGIFSEVSVTPQADARVPILNVRGASTATEGAIFLWISTARGDELEVAYETPDGPTSFASAGEAGGVNSQEWDDPDDFDVVIINGREGDFDVRRGSVVVTIAGTWAAGRAFTLRLRGQASARMWVTGTGQAGILGGGPGPLLTRARRLGTVAIPGSHPELITVGATQNRSSWVDFEGNEVRFDDPQEGVADFSSAGPNLLGDLKPELVAPGGGVIGAMSRAADPRTPLSRGSQFASNGACPSESECFVVDDEHAVSSGTSMAAPIVAGAIALLLERDPTLTMKSLKELLMAGTRRLASRPSEGGVGELSVVGALLAQEASLTTDRRDGPIDAERSWVVWANDFARPGTTLHGTAILRDAEDQPVADADSLQLQVAGPGVGRIDARGPGWARLSLSVEQGTGGQQLELRVLSNDALLDTRSLSIALDPIQAEHGFTVAGAGCAQGPPHRPGPGWGGWLALLLAITAFVRRENSKAR